MPAAAHARLFDLLEALQARPLVTGRELADRLGVDRRTVRRHVATLQELGIPVEGARGVGGGYRLRPGYRLPPLMLTDAEAVSTVVGLVAARELGLGDAEAAAGALAKVERVLPEALRARAGALEATVAFTQRAPDAPGAGTAVLVLAQAIRRRRRVRAGYRSHAGEASERELSPLGLVVHGGRWTCSAHDHGRDALRTFRVDRVSGAAIADEPALPPPAGYDAVAEVTRALARVPWPWEVEVELEVPPEEAARRLGPALAELEPAGAHTVARLRVSSLDWAAGLLAGLECAFTIRRPDELRVHVRALAQRLACCSRR